MKRSFVLLALAAAPLCLAQQPGAASLLESFANPPDDARVMMRWWWFGPAVTREGLAREMRAMREGGIGGFEVQPVYAFELDNEERGIRNVPYMSEEFLDLLRFTADEAQRLGLRFDLTLGSGWPFGGPHIRLADSSGALRIERVKPAPGQRRVTLPDLRGGEKLLAAFAVQAEEIAPSSPRRRPQYRLAGDARKLSNIRDGALWLPDGFQSDESVWFFLSSFTGKLVERSAVAADGFILDHYRREALQIHLRSIGEPLLRALGPNRLPYAVFCDSLEVDNSDWTPNFLREFRERRGYDLSPYLPLLASNAAAPDLRHDWGKTLSELLTEEFLDPLYAWSQDHGVKLRMQAYGAPPATLGATARVDLPEGESSHWKTLTPSRWASSGAHIYGRPVASAETWTWLHSPVFRATPLDMKAEADRHFLQGVTQLVGHGWPYTPEGIADPGWHFYAAGVFNDKNPWWIVMPEVMRYCRRVSHLLRQGAPANDVALYLPTDDAWSDMALGEGNLIRMIERRMGSEIIEAIVDAGYGFDLFDDEALARAGAVEQGALRLGDNRYPIVVLPALETIPPDTLAKLDAARQAGATVVAVGQAPQRAPGRLASEPEHKLVQELAANLRLLDGPNSLPDALRTALAPDVDAPAPALGFLHRRAADAEIYFLANTGNRPIQTTARFRIPGESLAPEWWDPFTGEASGAAVAQRSGASVSINLDLEPYGSRVVVFRRAAAAPQPAPTPKLSERDLSRDWRVRFRPHGPAVTMDRLRSWTDDLPTRYFCGVATYEKTFEAQEGTRFVLDFGEPAEVEPPPAGAPGMRALLEGPVREAAVVWLNGKRVGSVWKPPYRLNLSAHILPGTNELRIEVANLAVNQKAGQALPNRRFLNWIYTERFTDQDMDKIRPEPAGLLGPVRLLFEPRP